MRQARIPIIDIASPSQEVADAVLNAASTYGFIYIKNLSENESSENEIGGILPKDIHHLFNISEEFFQSPFSTKNEHSIHSGKNQGYIPLKTEALDPSKAGDSKECFNFGEFNAEWTHAQQPLPAPLAAYELDIARFQGKCHAFCQRILALFAQALHITDTEGGHDWFTSRHARNGESPSGSILRMLYYPACPSPNGTGTQGNSSEQPPDASMTKDIRAGAHSDYGSVTLLFQQAGQPGLEILSPEGEWVEVAINPANDSEIPILVNVGDLLEFWTAGLLKSTVHRVVYPVSAPQDQPSTHDSERGGSEVWKKGRYSIVYFCHPRDDVPLLPVPSPMVQSRLLTFRDTKTGHAGPGSSAAVGGTAKSAPGGGVLTAHDHLLSRLRATYGESVVS